MAPPNRHLPAGVRRTAPPSNGGFAQELAAAGVPEYAREVMTGARHAVPTTGVMPVDVMGDMLNTHIDPFVQVPTNEDGSVNTPAYVFNVLGGALSLMGIVENLIDHGLAVLLAPFAQMGAMPAATLIDLHVGMPHGHNHPPSLIVPPPIPLPSLGPLMLSGAVTVLVGGIPAARAGDIGLAPTCGSFAPHFMVVTGSSSVFIGGRRAARMGDLTIHCNPILAKILQFSAAAAAMGAVGGAISVGAAAASGNAVAAGAAAIQAAADVIADAIKSIIGMDPGVPPMVMGAITTGTMSVEIGGLPVPPADLLLGMLRGDLDLDSVTKPRNQHHDDADSDPHQQRRNRRGSCSCG
jgi:uncharacterized Zn-binding protein involved in type VI secretion